MSVCILNAEWWAAVRAAAERRDFPSLRFAEQWLRSLAGTGVFGRVWGDGKGD